MLFIGSQLAAVRLWGVQRRKSELVFAKGRTQDGRPRFRVDAKFGVDVPDRSITRRRSERMSAVVTLEWETLWLFCR